jgi:hypothetical protein
MEILNILIQVENIIKIHQLVPDTIDEYAADRMKRFI